MRKPLVVLGVLASALLVGGVATTRAMAQEPPDEFAGITIFGLPLVSGGESAADDPVGDDVPDTSDSESAASNRKPSPRPVVRSPVVKGPMVESPVVRSGPTPEESPPETSPAPRLQVAARHRDYGFASAADPIAASHTTVTAESVSSSPVAPVQQQILALVNRQRAKAGCRPVSIDRRLIDAANGHAADMARRDYFEHESPNGEKAGERVSEAGYKWRRYGENIARGQLSPWEVMDNWMESPGHRANILDCQLDQMGAGLALGGDRTPYWVQDFATPK